MLEDNATLFYLKSLRKPLKKYIPNLFNVFCKKKVYFLKIIK